jgi:hypothetical protein
MLQVQSPFQQIFDSDGYPLDNGSVFIGMTGQNPETNPIVVYWDSALTLPAAQPLKTLNGYLTRSGTPARVFTSAESYSLTVKDNKSRTVVSTLDATALSNLQTQLASSIGSSMIGFIQGGADAVLRTMQSKGRESVTPDDFTGNEDTSRMLKAITYCKANGLQLQLPKSYYDLDAAAGLNFSGMNVMGIGKPKLQYFGAGRGFVMDAGGGSGSNIGGMNVENLIIVGNSSVSDGFYNRGIVRSVFRNIEVRECYNTAFTILHGVSNHYDSIKYSTNEVAQATTPLKGVVLDNNGAGYYTADCTFTNCISEGFPGLGMDIVDGSGNVFTGGTFEAVTKGITIEAVCDHNHFTGVWCEGNTTSDLEVYGRVNAFDDCFFVSAGSGNNIELITAQGTNFRGGFVRVANMQSTSRDTSFFGVSLSDNGGLNFKGVGSYTRVGCTGLDIAGAVTQHFPDITKSQWLTFPAAQVPSSDVNTLDDYEEGTWTPVLEAASGTITPNAGFTGGRYTKVGNLVTINGTIYVSDVAAPSGLLKMTGIPFTTGIEAFDRCTATVVANNLQATATTQITGQLQLGQGYIVLRRFAAGVLSELGADVKAATEFTISATYQVYQP